MTDAQEGRIIAATVTLDQIYSTLQEVRDDVRDMKKELGELAHDSKDHEQRIRALEKLVWRASGAAALAGSAIGFMLNKLLGGG